MRQLLIVAIAACGGARSADTLQSLRVACDPTQHWNGTTCIVRGDGATHVAVAKQAVVDQDVDRAKIAIAAADKSGLLDHDNHVALWEQRGIAAMFVEDEPTARSAFDVLLALDPAHLLSYRLAPAVLLAFEKVRDQIKKRRPPEVDVAWPSGLETGDPIPLDVEVIADPKSFLKRATVFVRARGDSQWRASDLTLAPKPTRVVIPPVRSTVSTSVELYLRAYDDRGNEVLAWSDPTRPREIPLRYDPPPKWYRNWKTYAIGGTAAVLVTALVVYAVTLSPPDDASGSGVVK